MANDTQKLDRYFRELTKWGKKMAEAVDKLEQRVGNGETGGGRGPGGPPPPPDLGGDA